MPRPFLTEADTLRSRHPRPVRLQILGPVRLWRDGVELDVGPRQQVHLLALLLAREGQPTDTGELIELIWGDEPPTTALNVIHKYVGALRRLLEPALPSRSAGSYLLRRGNGYLCVAGTGALDMVDFRELMASARFQRKEQRDEVALDLCVQALALWTGPAADGLVHGPVATAIFAQLDDEFLAAAVLAAELAVTLGQPERVLAPLRLAARMAPLHEPVHASLMAALAAAGQQADALSVFGAVRDRLADDLGIDPGPALDAAYLRVLRQELTPARREIDTARSDPGPQAPSSAPLSSDTNGSSPLIGRVEELALLRQALARGRAGDPALVLVEGEPGMGKTRLLEEVAAEAVASDALVVWGPCLEGAGTPSMWPWVQITGTLLARMAPDERQHWLAGELGRLLEPPGTVPHQTVADSNTQFLLFKQVVRLLEAAAAQRPLVLVLDDLQWADAASLGLLGHLGSEIPAGLVVLGAFRDRAPTPDNEMVRALAALCRAPDHRRILLGPLDLDEVAELVRRETGHAPARAAARSVLVRTDGNPFFVQELSRLLASGGELTEASAARPEVPATVKDLVLDLTSGLQDTARELLQLAALIGRQVDLGLLARAAGLDVHRCLERLEAVEALGLLGPTPDDPFSYRFEHDLVRESVSAAVSAHRAFQLHLRVADALQDDGPVDDPAVEELAHHLWAAGPLADPTRTVTALVQAGRRATIKTALDIAERQLRRAVHLARTAGLPDVELVAISELIRVVSMSSPHGTAAIELQERAEHLALSTGRPEEAAVLLYSRWMALAYGGQYGRSEVLARRLLEQGLASSLPVVRALGLQAWGLQQVSVGNIGEAFRYLTEASQDLLIVPAQREMDVVWYAQQLSAVGMLAETTSLHGDVEGASLLLDRLEVMAGDDPFTVTVWAVHAVRIASVVGDPVRALAVTKKGIAADPDLSFGFFGMYQRLARFWALAMTDQDASGAATEVDRLITENLLDPPRSDIATWYGLLAEMRLRAGSLDLASAALDLADRALEAYGQRYCEGLILLMRARLLQAQGRPSAVVRAAAEAAREHSISHEAYLFAHRAEQFLADLDGTGSPCAGGAGPGDA